VEGGRHASQLTAREREVAGLIRRGLTNRQIGLELAISERTVGAHVQNVLNKLGASKRAEIAAWSVQDSIDSKEPWTGVRDNRQAESSVEMALVTPSAQARQGPGWLIGLLAALAVVVAATDDGGRPSFLSPDLLPAATGSLAYEAKLAGDGEGFGARYILGDPSASKIRFTKGAVEFAVVKPGGNTGNNVAMEPVARYYAEVQLSVVPGSNVEFWFNLGSNGSMTHIGDHLIDVQTAAEVLQLQYFVQIQGGLPLGPQVLVNGLQAGRSFTISVLVDPPNYQVYLDGRRVVSLQHTPSAALQAPSFAIFGDGDGTGTVRLTAMRVYRLT
jgi:DNA-binding CsgD family transcriptional regulator